LSREAGEGAEGGALRAKLAALPEDEIDMIDIG
jgi:hypothetical protein